MAEFKMHKASRATVYYPDGDIGKFAVGLTSVDTERPMVTGLRYGTPNGVSVLEVQYNDTTATHHVGIPFSITSDERAKEKDGGWSSF